MTQQLTGVDQSQPFTWHTITGKAIYRKQVQKKPSRTFFLPDFFRQRKHHPCTSLFAKAWTELEVCRRKAYFLHKFIPLHMTCLPECYITVVSYGEVRQYALSGFRHICIRPAVIIITLTVSWPCLQRKASTLDWPEPWVRDPERQGRIPESLLCRCSWQTSALWWRMRSIIKIV